MAIRTRHPRRVASSARRRGADLARHAAPTVRRAAIAAGDAHDRPRSRTSEHDAAATAYDDGVGLLFAFVATTLVMVVGISAMALSGGWWWLVPVVLVHLVATYVILARINALLDDA